MAPLSAARPGSASRSAPRSALHAAGALMGGQSMGKDALIRKDALTQKPQTRFLASAFDSNFQLKTVIPPGAIPGSRKEVGEQRNAMARNLSSAQLKARTPQSRQRSMSVTHLGFSRPSPLSTSRPFTSQSLPVSPFASEGSDKSSVKSASRRASRTQELASSLPALALAKFVARPSSANSSQDSPKAPVVADDDEEEEREEKPLVEWADEGGVPLDLAHACLAVFMDFVSNPAPEEFAIEREAVMRGDAFDAGVDLGSMDNEAFGNACLRIADCRDFSQLPDGFLESAMTSADKDGSGDIDFGEFLYFYYKFSFSEEVLVGNEERQIRSAAREYNIPYDEMGKYKYVFDQTDLNRNGRIDYGEFKVLVNKLLKVPGSAEIPERRSKEMWKEAACKAGGKDLDFVTFVSWYKRYFKSDRQTEGESPFEAYYHNIRRVCMYDSANFH